MNANNESARDESAGASTPLIDTAYPTTNRASGDLLHESARLSVVYYKKRPAMSEFDISLADAARFLRQQAKITCTFLSVKVIHFCGMIL
jgi:hypothetical protein